MLCNNGRISLAELERSSELRCKKTLSKVRCTFGNETSLGCRALPSRDQCRRSERGEVVSKVVTIINEQKNSRSTESETIDLAASGGKELTRFPLTRLLPFCLLPFTFYLLPSASLCQGFLKPYLSSSGHHCHQRRSIGKPPPADNTSNSYRNLTSPPCLCLKLNSAHR